MGNIFIVVEEETTLFNPLYLFIGLGVGLLFTVALYVLRSVALFTMAKKQGLKNKWLIFVPFLWVYTASKLSGETYLFGRKFKEFPLVLCLVFTLFGLAELVCSGLIYFPIVKEFLCGNGIIFATGEYIPTGVAETWLNGIYTESEIIYPYANPYAVAKVCSILTNYVLRIVELFEIILLVTMYFNFFRRYWPLHNFAGGFFSLFGLFGIFAFIVRKNEPVNYAEFVRNRYRSYGVGYGAPHGGFRETPPETPFRDFAEKGDTDPGDPFEEFSDKKDDGDDE